MKFNITHRQYVWLNFLLISNLIICGMVFFLMLAPQGLPNFKLIRYNLGYALGDDGNIRYVKGDYYVSGNTIRIAIEGNEVDKVLYHEYAHWMFSNMMNKKERQQWNSMCNNIPLEGYTKDEYCEEQFVRGFSDYVSNEGYNSILLPTWKGMEKEYNFTRDMYSEYITER